MHDAEHTSRETLYQGRHLRVVRREGWEYVSRNVGRPAIGIVAVTGDGKVVLVEQMRAPVGRSVVEIPAGLSGDVAGSEDESLLEAARRELLEETGYEAGRWTGLGEGLSSPGLTDESIVLFLAEDLRRVSDGGGDESESIEMVEVEMDSFMAWLTESGATVDLKTLAGLYLAQEQLRARQNQD